MTGLPAAVFQPFFFQPGSQTVIELSISCESVTTVDVGAVGQRAQALERRGQLHPVVRRLALAAGVLDRLAAVGAG